MAAANVVILMSSVHTQSAAMVGEKFNPIILIVSLVFCVVMVAVLYWNDRR